MAKGKRPTGTNGDVGYCRPPAHSRFKAGQSGNPGGRKKGSSNVRTVIEEVLNQEVVLLEDGQRRKVSVLRAIILRAVKEALSGNMRALDSLLDRAERHLGGALVDGADDLPEEDRAIIERFQARQHAPKAGKRAPARMRMREEGENDA